MNSLEKQIAYWQNSVKRQKEASAFRQRVSARHRKSAAELRRRQKNAAALIKQLREREKAAAEEAQKQAAFDERLMKALVTKLKSEQVSASDA